MFIAVCSTNHHHSTSRLPVTFPSVWPGNHSSFSTLSLGWWWKVTLCHRSYPEPRVAFVLTLAFFQCHTFLVVTPNSPTSASLAVAFEWRRVVWKDVGESLDHYNRQALFLSLVDIELKREQGAEWMWREHLALTSYCPLLKEKIFLIHNTAMYLTYNKYIMTSCSVVMCQHENTAVRYEWIHLYSYTLTFFASCFVTFRFLEFWNDLENKSCNLGQRL